MRMILVHDPPVTPAALIFIGSIMQGEQSRGGFVKGMSLEAYMKDMNCPEETEAEAVEEQKEETLMHCQPSQVASFPIREIDEENYDEQNPLIIAPLQKVDLQQSRVVAIQDKHRVRKPIHYLHEQQARIKHSSNTPSPIKPIFSPKKELFRSLYGHSFLDGRPENSTNQLLSTLGINHWRGRNKSLKGREAEVKEKNKRQYKELIKYENVISQRFDHQVNAIRVEGCAVAERGGGKHRVSRIH